MNHSYLIALPIRKNIALRAALRRSTIDYILSGHPREVARCAVPLHLSEGLGVRFMHFTAPQVPMCLIVNATA